MQSSDGRVHLEKDGQAHTHTDVRLDTHRDSLSRNELLTRRVRPTKHFHSKHTHTHQGIKHEDVIVVSLRVLHHDVEQGIQRVLQELHTHTQTGAVRAHT